MKLSGGRSLRRRKSGAAVHYPGPSGGYSVPIGNDTAAELAKTEALHPGPGGGGHTTKWLCMDCLKTRQDVPAGPEFNRRICPSCGGVSFRVGTRFRPPKLSDLRGWRKTIDFLERYRFGNDETIARLRAALEVRRAAKRKKR